MTIVMPDPDVMTLCASVRSISRRLSPSVWKSALVTALTSLSLDASDFLDSLEAIDLLPDCFLSLLFLERSGKSSFDSGSNDNSTIFRFLRLGIFFIRDPPFVSG